MLLFEILPLLKQSILFIFFCCLCSLSPTILICDEVDYKKEITICQKQIDEAISTGKGDLLKKLSVLYYKDQNQEKAFQTFLEALEMAEQKKLNTKTECEEKLYNEALILYFKKNEGSAEDIAEKICEQYSDVIKDYPDMHLLAYLIAIAYANLNQYEEFFNIFYDAYCFCSDHFLAYKTKAILHIKLFERARTEAERRYQQGAVCRNLELAMSKETKDDTLYKLLINFSSQEKKQATVRHCLNKILDANMIIPRSDILFFVQEAVHVQEKALAQRFLKKAHEWYPQSRIVNAAQAYLVGEQISPDTHIQMER